jgi:hypothetical protein
VEGTCTSFAPNFKYQNVISKKMSENIDEEFEKVTHKVDVEFQKVQKEMRQYLKSIIVDTLYTAYDKVQSSPVEAIDLYLKAQNYRDFLKGFR